MRRKRREERRLYQSFLELWVGLIVLDVGKGLRRYHSREAVGRLIIYSGEKKDEALIGVN